MSKFIDRLNRVTHTAPQPIGFRTAQAEAPPVMQLIARLTGDGDPKPARLKAADACLATVTAVTSGATRIKKLAKDMPDIVWGAQLEGASRNDLEKTAKMGDDFVLFAASGTPASTPAEDGPAIVLEIDAATSDTLLRTVNDAAVDAVLVSDGERGEGPISWLGMLRLQRVAKLVSLPLLVATPAAIGGGELRVLSEAGVAGIVVDISVGDAADLLAELRKTIAGLPPPVSRKRRAEAVLPRLGMVTASAHDDGGGDEEPDEDDDEFD